MTFVQNLYTILANCVQIPHNLSVFKVPSKSQQISRLSKSQQISRLSKSQQSLGPGKSQQISSGNPSLGKSPPQPGRMKFSEEIGKMCKYTNILYSFAYVFVMFSAFPSPIMEAAFGRLHNGGRAAFGPLWIPLWGLGRRQT